MGFLGSKPYKGVTVKPVCVDYYVFWGEVRSKRFTDMGEAFAFFAKQVDPKFLTIEFTYEGGETQTLRLVPPMESPQRG